MDAIQYNGFWDTPFLEHMPVGHLILAGVIGLLLIITIPLEVKRKKNYYFTVILIASLMFSLISSAGISNHYYVEELAGEQQQIFEDTYNVEVVKADRGFNSLIVRDSDKDSFLELGEWFLEHEGNVLSVEMFVQPASGGAKWKLYSKGESADTFTPFTSKFLEEVPALNEE